MPSREPASDSPSAIRAEALRFRDEMREIIEDIREPGLVTPGVLAERFCENEVAGAKRRWASRKAVGLFIAEAQAQARADIGLKADPDPLYDRFLMRLVAELTKASEANRDGQPAG